MNGPNPELMHLYGTDAYYLEKTGQMPGVMRALAGAAGFGLYLHDKKHVEDLLLEAELMNRQLRAAEAAKMQGAKAGFEGRLRFFRGRAPIEIDPAMAQLSEAAAMVKGGSVQLNEDAEKVATFFGGRLATGVYKKAQAEGDEETLELLEKLASGEELTEMEKAALVSQILRGLGGLVGAGGRATTRLGNLALKGSQTGAGRAVARLGAKGQAAGEKLLLRGGATPTAASKAWSGARTTAGQRVLSAPPPPLPKPVPQATAATRASVPTAATRVGTPTAPTLQSAGVGGPYRTAAPVSAPAQYGTLPPKPVVVPKPAPPKPGSLMEGGAEAGFTRGAQPGAAPSPWAREGEQILAQRKAGQEALARQRAAAPPAAAAAAPVEAAAEAAGKTKKPLIGWKTKALLGAGALGAGYAGYKGLQTARDYMMTPTMTGGAWGGYGGPMPQEVSPYGYVQPAY